MDSLLLADAVPALEHLELPEDAEPQDPDEDDRAGDPGRALTLPGAVRVARPAGE